jgi:hypothetical protein
MFFYLSHIISKVCKFFSPFSKSEEKKARRAIRKIQRQIELHLSTKCLNNNTNENDHDNNSMTKNDPQLEELKKQLKKYEEDLLYILVMF